MPLWLKQETLPTLPLLVSAQCVSLVVPRGTFVGPVGGLRSGPV